MSHWVGAVPEVNGWEPRGFLRAHGRKVALVAWVAGSVWVGVADLWWVLPVAVWVDGPTIEIPRG